MTYKEMYDHLAKDVFKVRIKQENLLPKAIRLLKKERRFPVWRYYEYTAPITNNKYIIYFYAESRFHINKPTVGSFAVLFCENKRYVVQWVAGGYKHTKDGSLIAIRQIHAYTSHFFRRYNERHLKNESLDANDVACAFLAGNQLRIPICMNEEINRSLEKYGEGAKYGYQVRDGFCFADSWVEGVESADGDRHNDQVDAMLVLYKTFMDKLGLADSQKIAIDKEKQDVIRRTIQDLQEKGQGELLLE